MDSTLVELSDDSFFPVPLEAGLQVSRTTVCKLMSKTSQFKAVFARTIVATPHN